MGYVPPPPWVTADGKPNPHFDAWLAGRRLWDAFYLFVIAFGTGLLIAMLVAAH